MTTAGSQSNSPTVNDVHVVSRGRIFAWTLFDFGNTAFSVIIVTVIYNRYFTNHVASGQSWLWGLAVSLSMICAALIAPPLGAAADFSRNKKRFLFLFTLASVLSTALMFFVQEGMVILGMLLFIIANTGFEGGIVFYDSFITSITSKNSYGRVSGYGFAMGYLGALAVLIIVNLMLPDTAHPDYLYYVRMSFVVAAGFFLLFSFPMFLWVPEPHHAEYRPTGYIKAGIGQSAKTFRSLFVKREYPSVARFLIAFFIYNDGILTIIAFAAIFAEHILHMSDKDIIVFFAVVQTSAVIGSFIFGIITDKIGPKKTISITLCIWIAITIGAYFVSTVSMFYIVALGAGVAIGSSQSASRSLMALLTPKEREAEFFGFYDGLCGKASAVIGPLLYGLIADFTNERLAALFIGLFFLIGLIILQGVTEPERKSALPVTQKI
ncbi:MAG: MFS transporter [Ignavibacteriales bacterium]|nr:MFS transporter [Ignavibacteriales bacterium]